MSEEKLHVLRMLQQGTITYEEALQLLNALGEKTRPAAADDRHPAPDMQERLHGDDDGEEEDEEEEDEEEDEDDDDEDDEADGDEDADGELEGFDGIDDAMQDAYGQVKDAMREVSHSLSGIGEEVSGELRDAMRDVAAEVGGAMRTVSSELKEALREAQNSEGWNPLPGIFGWAPCYTFRSDEQIPVPAQVDLLELSVSTKNGSIHLTAGEQDSLRLLIVKKIRAENKQAASELAAVCVEREQQVLPDRLQLRLLVPETLAGVSVSFELSVPERLLSALKLYSKNGGIALEKMQGDAELETKNGGLRVVGGKYGRLRASSKNGSIALMSSLQTATVEAKNGSVHCLLQPTEDSKLDVRNHNGSIVVELPSAKDLGCKVEAMTTHGALRVNLPDFMVKELSRQRLVGQTRDLQQMPRKLAISAETKNGSIAVRTI